MKLQRCLGWVAVLSMIGSTAFAKQIKLDVGLAKPTLAVGDGGKVENHMRIALTGFELNKERERMPTSVESWEKAARNAVETAAASLRDLRIAEVVKQDMKVENGKVVAFRTRVLLSFKYQS